MDIWHIYAICGGARNDNRNCDGIPNRCNIQKWTIFYVYMGAHVLCSGPDIIGCYYELFHGRINYVTLLKAIILSF